MYVFWKNYEPCLMKLHLLTCLKIVRICCMFAVLRIVPLACAPRVRSIEER